MLKGEGRREEARTERNVVVTLDGDILRFLDVVDALEDSQAVADTSHAHGPEIIMEQSYKSLTDDLVLYTDKQFHVLD